MRTSGSGLSDGHASAHSNLETRRRWIGGVRASAQGRQLQCEVRTQFQASPAVMYMLLALGSFGNWEASPLSPVPPWCKKNMEMLRNEWPERLCLLVLQHCPWIPGSRLPVWVEKSFPFSYCLGSDLKAVQGAHWPNWMGLVKKLKGWGSLALTGAFEMRLEFSTKSLA